MAQMDIEKALPKMIQALRNSKQATTFDYADDPMFRDLSKDERPTPEQRQWRMIERLREATGQDFGYNPDASTEEKEKAIADWENWLQQ